MHYYRGPRRQNNRAKFSCCQVRLSERNDSHEEHAAISPAMFTFHCRGIAMHIRALHFKNQSIRGDTGEGPVNCSFHKSLSNGHAQLTSFGTGMYMYMYMHLISPSRCYSPIYCVRSTRGELTIFCSNYHKNLASFRLDCSRIRINKCCHIRAKNNCCA